MFNTSLRPPSASELEPLLADQPAQRPTYPGVGGTATGRVPLGFAARSSSVELGRGPEVWAAARHALSGWRAFPAGWSRVHPGPGGLRAGLELVVVLRALGLWWRAPARVVYVEDEPRKLAFAYGTLPSHPEAGEERFAVRWRDDDTVVYELSSFSRPRLWAARLAAPLTRALQRRFVRASLAAMRAAVLEDAK